uniref:ALMS motif domain-containing protein n=1 Tax=Chaetoceros debilis TaxID=122233 RepID=A0A7S3Q295_9STRA|mmetsp:Transcript_9298/g.13895  ORF Transcript_9298/g.13895 Transcript_9298/m.13895 type:complete len:609 (+) Transcript_9298:119-1945(+)|eukprot:CAMPEP_0194086918 /NCGR_PEP_ID=MMETSP0149-20130528/22979_1 /TAXON_ID=122233 /ORGANISM="Chaetoceros debilis, Strain MM31A-1" /LENGTH=608 /DNA_ID=CAMNT_0038770133 /DNA_START=61 /DNA_END=1887 /DNA_ORIENTATION=-
MENATSRYDAMEVSYERMSANAFAEIGNNAFQKPSALSVHESPCNRQSDKYQHAATSSEEQWFHDDRAKLRSEYSFKCSSPKGKISHADLQALFLKSEGSLQEIPNRSPRNRKLASMQEHNNWVSTTSASSAASPKSQNLAILKSVSSLSPRCSPKHSPDNKSVDFTTELKNGDEKVDPQLARLQQKVAILSKLHKIVYDMDDVSLGDDDMTATTAGDSFAGKSLSTAGDSLLGEFVSSDASVSTSIECDGGEISESEATLDSPDSKSKSFIKISTDEEKTKIYNHGEHIAQAKPRIETSRATTPMTRHNTSVDCVKKNIPMSPSLRVTPQARGGKTPYRPSFTPRSTCKTAARLPTTPRTTQRKSAPPPMVSPAYKDFKAKKIAKAKNDKTTFRFENLYEYGKDLLKFNQERVQRHQELKNERYGPTLKIPPRIRSDSVTSASTSTSASRSKSASAYRSKPVLTPVSTRSNATPSRMRIPSPLNITVTSPRYKKTYPKTDPNTFRFDNLHEYGKGLQKAKRERRMQQELKEKQRAIEMELQFKRRQAAKMKKVRELTRSENVSNRLYNAGTFVNNINKSNMDGKVRREEIARKAKLREFERRKAFRC